MQLKKSCQTSLSEVYSPTSSNTYECIGPFGNGPGFQDTEILLESTAVALIMIGGDDGIPAAKVLMTTLGSETIGSLCGDSKSATRNWKMLKVNDQHKSIDLLMTKEGFGFSEL